MITFIDKESGMDPKLFVDVPVSEGRTIKGFKLLADRPGYGRFLEYKHAHVTELAAAEGVLQSGFEICRNMGVANSTIYIMMKGLVKTMEKQCGGSKDDNVRKVFEDLLLFADFSFDESELTKEIMSKADEAAGKEGYA